MAKATRKLIKALRDAAFDIDAGNVEYNWSSSSECNCGILAQKIMGVTRDTLWDEYIKGSTYHLGTWGDTAEHYMCITTGEALDDVFTALRSVGLKWQDMKELEWLGNKEVCERAGLDVVDVNNADPVNTAKYMYAWADMLEEELNEQAEELVEL